VGNSPWKQWTPAGLSHNPGTFDEAVCRESTHRLTAVEVGLRWVSDPPELAVNKASRPRPATVASPTSPRAPNSFRFPAAKTEHMPTTPSSHSLQSQSSYRPPVPRGAFITYSSLLSAGHCNLTSPSPLQPPLDPTRALDFINLNRRFALLQPCRTRATTVSRTRSTRHNRRYPPVLDLRPWTRSPLATPCDSTLDSLAMIARHETADERRRARWIVQ
jgi:hypothetical protein